MNQQPSARLEWVDRLHEVGDPIRKRRAVILDLLDQAQSLEHQALALRGRAVGEHTALIDAVLRNWSEDEVNRARAAVQDECPTLRAAGERPMGVLSAQIDSLAVSAARQSAQLDLMRAAIDLALKTFDSPRARNPLRDIGTYHALRALHEAAGRTWPHEAA